ncbi:MAG TPA: hypothetical protein VGN00_28295 [Puia sp.]|jgi:hypothetical protein
MKKFLVVLAIGAFAACNNSGGTEAPHDSTVVKDSVTKMSSDSTSKMMSDSTSKMSDSTKKDTTTKK